MPLEEMMQERSQPGEAVPRTAEEMIAEFVNFYTATHEVIFRAVDDRCGPELGGRFRAEHTHWVREILLPLLVCHWAEIQQEWGKIRPFLLQMAEDPTVILNDKYWPFVKENIEGLRRRGYLPSSMPVEELAAALLLQPQPRPIPPGHTIWRALGVHDVGEWDRLTPAQQWQRLPLAWAEKGRHQIFVRRVFHMLAEWAEDEARKSVSGDHVVNEESALKVEDVAATRFVQQLEVEDEIDRLLARVHLSSSERLVAAGLREGLDGEGLKEYVLQQPGGRRLSPKSIPVLASKIRSKLRAAAEQ